MNLTFGVYRNCLISLLLACAAWGQTPTVFLAGDSTAADGNPDAIGWGKPLPKYFDASRIRIANRARGGRSSRTFITEGLWAKLLEGVQPNDYVLIQFGHNDGGPIDEAPRRGSVPGLGEQTPGDIHTYGWYMRTMIRETREKGATPILFSLTVRNIWKVGFRCSTATMRWGNPQWSRFCR